MAERTVLAGRYRIANVASVRTRMASLQGDPRLQFYQAMVATNRYETYLDAVGDTKVTVESYHQGPISGRMEILYARRSGWIADASETSHVSANGILEEITPDAIQRAVAEFDNLSRDVFLKRYGFGRAREYLLVIDGKRYDSKAIVGAAFQHVSEGKEPLPAKRFSGGEKTVARILETLGFTVERISEVPPPAPSFERGKIYNRRSDIHAIYGGQQQGGIATPAGPYVFLFTGEQGTTYGYQDGMRPDGVFEYTGEGQIGDMKFVKGNKAIRDHATNGKDLLVFETSKAKGKCRYLGSFVCDGWNYRDSTDKNDKSRKVIIFDLIPVENLESDQPLLHDPSDANLSIEDLRKRAYTAAATPTTSQGQTRRNVYARSRDVRDYVLARAKGACEACRDPAPFKRADGTPYLEPHHTRRLSDGGPDHPRWVGAICPTCHRRIHHGAGGMQVNEALQVYLGEVEGTTH